MAAFRSLYNGDWILTSDFQSDFINSFGDTIDFRELDTLLALCLRLETCMRVGTARFDGMQHYAVYATSNISKGQVVTAYLGRDSHFNQQRKSDFSNDKIVNYDERVVCADAHLQTNLAHYINDCSDGGYVFPELANLKFVCVPVTNKRCVVFLVALRDISTNEQLLAEYGDSYWKTKNANGEAVYKPEMILDESDERDQYLVKWLHFNEISWEPRSYFENCIVVDEWERRVQSGGDTVSICDLM